MQQQTITAKDRARAQVCVNCPLCRQARKTQKGLAYWSVKNIETRVCPFCRAYEKVYGKKAHEPTEPRLCNCAPE